MPDTVSPILASSDLDATVTFYGGLGFDVEGLYPDEYLLLRKGDIGLHFWFAGPEWDRAVNHSGAYLYVDDLPAWATRCAAASLSEHHLDIPRFHRPRATDYGLTEMALVDPDGNLLRIGSRP